jgi:hypothetical protein
MMKNRLANWQSLFFFLLLGYGTVASGQSLNSLNYGFVSPNTRENLQLQDAIRGMKSTQALHLMKEARRLGCVVRSRIRVFPSLGSWSDGAEHSVLIRVRTDEPTVRYLVSRMGRDARQKSVLYFHPQSAGEAKIYTLRLRKRFNIVAIARILDRAGIAFRTLVPVKRGTIVYVVDLKRELNDEVQAASKQLGARVSSQTGSAQFVGDDAVPQARVVFDKEISNFEKSHPNLPAVCR